MMNPQTLSGVAGILLLVIVPSRAQILAIDPLAQTVGIGAPVSVQLSISGLGIGAAPSVGTFDVDLTFNASVLSFQSMTFGDPALGDQLDLAGLGSIKSSNSSVAGKVSQFELSLDNAATLNAGQANSFTLTTLHFTSAGAGTSSLNVVINAFGDALGAPLSVQIGSGSVSVVPEPIECMMVFGFTAAAVALALRKGRPT